MKKLHLFCSFCSWLSTSCRTYGICCLRILVPNSQCTCQTLCAQELIIDTKCCSRSALHAITISNFFTKTAHNLLLHSLYLHHVCLRSKLCRTVVGGKRCIGGCHYERRWNRGGVLLYGDGFGLEQHLCHCRAASGRSTHQSCFHPVEWFHVWSSHLK